MTWLASFNPTGREWAVFCAALLLVCLFVGDKFIAPRLRRYLQRRRLPRADTMCRKHNRDRSLCECTWRPAGRGGRT